MLKAVFALWCCLLASSSALAQDAGSRPPPRVGIVYPGPHPLVNTLLEGFKDALRRRVPDAVFVERHASGNPAEFGSTVLAVLDTSPALIATITTPLSRIAVDQARGRTPVVFIAVTDPVGAGLAASLDAPGRATGSSDLCPYEGLLQLARRVVPNARRVGVPYSPTDQPAVFGLSRLRALAPRFGLEVLDRQVTSRDELATDVRAIASRADVILLQSDNLLMENPALVTSSATAEGRPVIACDSASVDRGAVAGVSVSYREVGRDAGDLAAEILAGHVAGSLPVRVPSSGEVTINLRAACAAGVTISPSLLGGAATVLHRGEVCARPRPKVGWIYAGLAAVLLLGVAVVALRSRGKGPVGPA